MANRAHGVAATARQFETIEGFESCLRANTSALWHRDLQAERWHVQFLALKLQQEQRQRQRQQQQQEQQEKQQLQQLQQQREEQLRFKEFMRVGSDRAVSF